MENFAYKHINVTDKATYLEFRKQWKLDYQGKVNQIRQLKRDYKQFQRENPGRDPWKIRLARIEALGNLRTMLSDKWHQAELAHARYLAEKEKRDAA